MADTKIVESLQMERVKFLSSNFVSFFYDSRDSVWVVDILTYRQTDRHTDKQTDRQTDCFRPISLPPELPDRTFLNLRATKSVDQKTFFNGLITAIQLQREHNNCKSYEIAEKKLLYTGWAITYGNFREIGSRLKTMADKVILRPFLKCPAFLHLGKYKK